MWPTQGTEPESSDDVSLQPLYLGDLGNYKALTVPCLLPPPPRATETQLLRGEACTHSYMNNSSSEDGEPGGDHSNGKGLTAQTLGPEFSPKHPQEQEEQEKSRGTCQRWESWSSLSSMLASLVGSKSPEETCFKEQGGRVPRNNTQDWLLSSMCSCVHACARTYTHTHLQRDFNEVSVVHTFTCKWILWD